MDSGAGNDARGRRATEDRFIGHMALVAELQGKSQIQGRVLALLALCGRPVSLSEMSQRLSISKASASTTARKMVAEGQISKAPPAGDRKDYYTLQPDHSASTRAALARYLDRLSELHRQGATMLGALRADRNHNLHALADVYEKSAQALKAARPIQRLRPSPSLERT